MKNSFVEFDFYFDDKYLLENGLKCLTISHFDHFLSEMEAAECIYMYYQLAVQNNCYESIFKQIEKDFTSFFLYLKGGLNVYHSIKYEKLLSDKSFNFRVAQLIREKNMSSLFFEKSNCLLIPGYDLTHLLIFEEGFDENLIKNKLFQCNLHLLHKAPMSE